MEKVHWNDSFNIGHEKIDAEHRKMVEIIAGLHASLSRGIVNPQVGVALKELVNYTQEHFATEEGEMKQSGYPGYEAHKKLHEEFTKQVVKLLRDLKRGDSVNVFQLITLAKNWLSDHILTHDKKLGEFLKEQQKRSAATGSNR